MREIEIMKAPKEICAADFDSVDAKAYTFTDLWNRETPEKTKLKITYDEKNLYFVFRTEFEGMLPEKYKKKSGKVFRADCTEIFIGFGEDKTQYFEFDVSPFNRSFIARITNPDDLNPGIEMLNKGIVRTKTHIHEHHYETLYVLPFENFEKDGGIFFNAYRVKIENNKRVSRALNPTYTLSHHIKDSFIKLILK